MTYYLAIDIGASSGRHILGSLKDGKYVLEEVYRFENGYSEKNGHFCWDIDALKENVIAGIAKCKEIGKLPKTVGIDTWGVDFALLDENDQLIGDTVAYRDKRTQGVPEMLEKAISFQELYSRAGIQKQPYNTIYQLLALKEEAPEQLERAKTLLLMPEYLSFVLTGVKKNEYTNATTTSLVNAESKQWDRELIVSLGLPEHIFGELCAPGSTVGEFSKEIAQRVGFNATVVFPATHDTGSAFMAVPARDEQAVYISSGTWSLLGTESMVPNTSDISCKANFTNEGGYAYRYRYLKNIMGLWMIQSIRRNLDKKYSFAQLEEMAKESAYFTSTVDVNDNCFLAPESMIDEVKNYCARTGQAVPNTVGEVMQCVYVSLAKCYSSAIKNLEQIMDRKYTSVNIVGGGSKDGYLNSLTAKYTGLPVFAGPTEGTALGNLMCQMIADGRFADLSSARAAIKESFEIKTF